MTTVCEDDFRAELFIVMTRELVAKLGLRDAYVLSAIRFRTNSKHVDTVEDGGEFWWRTSIPDLSEFLGISVAQIRSALKSLTDAGILDSKVHAERGWTDRTLSYRAHLSEIEVCNCRNPQLPTGSISTDVHSLSNHLNICPPDGESVVAVTKSGPHLLPDDWEPTKTHRVKAEALGVDIDAAAEAMRKWAFVGDKRKTSWNGTFNAFLTNQKPTVVSVPSAESQVDRIIASGDREALEKLTGVRFDPDFGDVSPRERFERLKVEWPGWARENRARLVSAAVSHSKPR